MEAAEKLGVPFQKETSWLKLVNSQPTPTHGIVQNVPVKIGEWTETLDFSIVTIDDYSCVLEMDFMDKVKAVTIPFTNRRANTCTISLARGKAGTSTLSAL